MLHYLLDSDVPCVGVQVRDGPVLIESNWFHNFTRVEGLRLSYAVGFQTNSTGHSSPANSFGWNNFDDQVNKNCFTATLITPAKNISWTSLEKFISSRYTNTSMQEYDFAIAYRRG